MLSKPDRGDFPLTGRASRWVESGLGGGAREGKIAGRPPERLSYPRRGGEMFAVGSAFVDETQREEEERGRMWKEGGSGMKIGGISLPPWIHTLLCGLLKGDSGGGNQIQGGWIVERWKWDSSGESYH